MAGLPVPAAADPGGPVPGGIESWSKLFGVQQQLDAAADAIEGVATMAEPDGLAGFVADPTTAKLVVYWRGALPAAIAGVIAERRKDVPIDVMPAKFTKRELLAAMTRVADRGKRSGVPVTQLAPRADGAGLEVTVSGPAPAVKVAAGARAAASAGPAAALTDEAVDLMVSGGGTPVKLDSRENDSAPYFAGARTSTCTLGFAIEYQGVWNMLTAAHCVPSLPYTFVEDPAYNNGSNVTIGAARQPETNRTRDTTIVSVGGIGRTWDGGFRSTYSKPVRGASRSRVGNQVCVSGSRSGIQCGARVDMVDVSTITDEGVIFYPVVRAVADHQIVGEGDSGGPVFELPYPDDGTVIAKGGVSGMQTDSVGPCRIGETSNGRMCGSKLFYTDTVNTLEYYLAKIVTDGAHTGGDHRPGSLSGDNRAELVGVSDHGDGLLNGWLNAGYGAWNGPFNGIASGFPNPAVVRFADLDGDGKKDLIGVNVYGDGVINAWHNVDGLHSGWEGPYQMGGGWTDPAQVRFADLDGDGRDDLIAVNNNGDGVINALHNNGRAFRDWPWDAAVAHIGYGWTNPATVRFADINGDGYDDLIGVNNFGNGVITAWPNNKMADNRVDWTRWPWVNATASIGSGWTRPEVARFADLDGDGYDDLIAVNDTGDGAVHAWRNNHAAWSWPWGQRDTVACCWTGDPATVQFG